jgi:hypothetical protein
VSVVPIAVELLRIVERRRELLQHRLPVVAIGRRS